MQSRKVYLDNSATTIVNAEVIKDMEAYFANIYGNASSIHSFGRQAKEALNNSREQIASLLNASVDEIFFTGCGTESDNIAIFGILNAHDFKGHIITTKIEHHAVLYSCQYLEKNGYNVTYLDVDKDGVISLEDFKRTVRDDTVLVSIMHANNEVGAIQPIEEIGAYLQTINESRNNKIYFHTDAVQTAGKVHLDVKALKVDLLAISGHKFYAPKGIGVLYVKKGTKIKPITFGGSQESELRPGTENIPYIVGITKAFEIANAYLEENNKRVLFLREELKEGVIKKIPEVIINGSGSKAVSSILNVSFKYIEGEALLVMLDMCGIAASTGSACAVGLGGSHVLQAMCVDPIAAQGTIRFSFGCYNTQNDVDYVLEHLPKIVEKLRLMSPMYKGKVLK
ncbi:MAG: IscS subfamily cysteine desulfurase [Endomicrobium sp.]|jgi:cysteine desulfurase|nr:IscS subfamily cysteine desulfurase [Endomicrobium sp.]